MNGEFIRTTAWLWPGPNKAGSCCLQTVLWLASLTELITWLVPYWSGLSLTAWSRGVTDQWPFRYLFAERRSCRNPSCFSQLSITQHTELNPRPIESYHWAEYTEQWANIVKYHKHIFKYLTIAHHFDHDLWMMTGRFNFNNQAIKAEESFKLGIPLNKRGWWPNIYFCIQ